MTDTASGGAPAPAVPPLPGFVTTLATALAQKAFTALAVALTAHGLLAADQSTALAEDCTGAVLILVGVAWTYLHSKHVVTKSQAAVTAALAATPPAKP